jgi:DNA-binding transcriptional regulator YdaS (Cro superfamily)
MKSISDHVKAAGGVTKVARALNLPIGTVSAWQTRNTIPPEQAIAFEAVTGASRHETRPDIFGELPTAPAPASPEAA